MESIFNHGVTDEEEMNLFGMILTEEQHLGSRDYCYGYIYKLYLIRKKPDIAKKYLDMIISPIMRLNFQFD